MIVQKLDVARREIDVEANVLSGGECIEHVPGVNLLRGETRHLGGPL